MSRNPLLDEKRQSIDVASGNVDTDASGDVIVEFGNLRAIEDVKDVDARAAGGFVVNPISVGGNDATLRVFQSDSGTDSDELSAINASNVTSIRATAWGR